MTENMRKSFDRVMLAYYRRKFEVLTQTNEALWNIATDLVHAIYNTEHDGSGTKDLKDFAETKRAEIVDLINRS